MSISLHIEIISPKQFRFLAWNAIWKRRFSKKPFWRNEFVNFFFSFFKNCLAFNKCIAISDMQAKLLLNIWWISKMYFISFSTWFSWFRSISFISVSYFSSQVACGYGHMHSNTFIISGQYDFSCAYIVRTMEDRPLQSWMDCQSERSQGLFIHRHWVQNNRNGKKIIAFMQLFKNNDNFQFVDWAPFWNIDYSLSKIHFRIVYLMHLWRF